MRRAVAVVLGTITGTALLVGAKLGNASSGMSATGRDAAAVPVTGGGATITATSSPAAPSGATATSLKAGTYNGSAQVNGGRYGTLSLSVTISGGRISSISATESGGETHCYHNACNTLKPEALRAQSADVASVSGATYSSSAFKSTLQAALNSAKA